jgi:uracil-DNA glycosylase
LQPSLRSIFKELASTVPGFHANHGDLSSWALQGVLLINTSLTVLPYQPRSHELLWSGFILEAIKYLDRVNPGVIYVLWGNEAREFFQRINHRGHVLTEVHPAARFGEFAGNNHFNQINNILVSQGKAPIVWSID